MVVGDDDVVVVVMQCFGQCVVDVVCVVCYEDGVVRKFYWEEFLVDGLLWLLF